MAIEVLEIDDSNLTATLSLQRRLPWQPPVLVGQASEGVTNDGGGVLFLPGGFHVVPPRGPERTIAQQLANYMAVKDLTEIAVRNKAQASALTAISQAAESRILQLNATRSPGPITGKVKSAATNAGPGQEETQAP
jgi:hypothetical protein